MKINSQSLEDTQVGYISQKYTLDKYTLERASSPVHHPRCITNGRATRDWKFESVTNQPTYRQTDGHGQVLKIKCMYINASWKQTDTGLRPISPVSTCGVIKRLHSVSLSLSLIQSSARIQKITADIAANCLISLQNNYQNEKKIEITVRKYYAAKHAR